MFDTNREQPSGCVQAGLDAAGRIERQDRWHSPRM